MANKTRNVFTPIASLSGKAIGQWRSKRIKLTTLRSPITVWKSSCGNNPEEIALQVIHSALQPLEDFAGFGDLESLIGELPGFENLAVLTKS